MMLPNLGPGVVVLILVSFVIVTVAISFGMMYLWGRIRPK